MCDACMDLDRSTPNFEDDDHCMTNLTMDPEGKLFLSKSNESFDNKPI